MGSPVITPEPPVRFWTAVREALAGTHRDYTEGGIGRAITLLAIPMVLEMVMESMFGVTDMFWVSHLGKDAVATVALTESMLTLIFVVAMGLSMATTAFVARRIGEKDPEGAAIAAVQAMSIGVLVSILSGICGILFARQLLGAMGATAAIIQTGQRYTAVLLGGTVTILMLFLTNAVFRGAGDAAIAMRVLWVANIINMTLDPCFIFGLGPFPKLGVEGAAVATTIGRGCGVLYQLTVLLSGQGRVVIRGPHIRFHAAVMWRLLRVSFSGMFQFLLSMGSWVALVRMIALFGAAALAGYAIAIRVVVFFILPSWGMSNAAATLVGQNLGAGKPGRAEISVWRAGFYNMLFLGGVAVLCLIFAEPIIRLFTSDPVVLPIGVSCIRIVSFGNVCYAYGMVMVQAFNGAGDTFTPMIINLFCYWLFQLPLAWTLARHTRLAATGVFLAIPIAETGIAVVSILVFRRGRWKKVRI
jgi:putative MATE family efflux protein